MEYKIDVSYHPDDLPKPDILITLTNIPSDITLVFDKVKFFMKMEQAEILKTKIEQILQDIDIQNSENKYLDKQ